MPGSAALWLSLWSWFVVPAPTSCVNRPAFSDVMHDQQDELPGAVRRWRSVREHHLIPVLQLGDTASVWASPSAIRLELKPPLLALELAVELRLSVLAPVWSVQWSVCRETVVRSEVWSTPVAVAQFVRPQLPSMSFTPAPLPVFTPAPSRSTPPRWLVPPNPTASIHAPSLPVPMSTPWSSRSVATWGAPSRPATPGASTPVFSAPPPARPSITFSRPSWPQGRRMH